MQLPTSFYINPSLITPISFSLSFPHVHSDSNKFFSLLFFEFFKQAPVPRLFNFCFVFPTWNILLSGNHMAHSLTFFKSLLKYHCIIVALPVHVKLTPIIPVFFPYFIFSSIVFVTMCSVKGSFFKKIAYLMLVKNFLHEGRDFYCIVYYVFTIPRMMFGT